MDGDMSIFDVLLIVVVMVPVYAIGLYSQWR